MTTVTTKADLQARVEELEAILASAPATPSAASDGRADQVVLVGFLRGVSELPSERENAKFQVTGILTNSTKETINGQQARVDLPVDGFIASDNGNGPLATELLEIARTTKWARVALRGFWTRRGEIQLRGGYLHSTGKQLRVQAIEVLAVEPLAEPMPEPTAPAAPFAEPTDEPVVF
jgi:hypothetical protein